MCKNLFLILLIISACQQKKIEYKYYSNGNIKTETELKGGKKHGMFIEYYESGMLKSKQEWRDGELNGHFEDYFLSGKVKTLGTFKNSRLSEMTDYFENGNVFQRYKIDSEGSVVDIERYLEDGSRDSIAYPYTYIVEGDSVNYGDSITFKCVLFNVISPTFKNGKLVILSKWNSVPNTGRSLTDTLAIISAVDECTYSYKLVAVQNGQNNIYGQLVFDSINSNELIRTVIDIHHRFFVEGH